MAKQVGNNATDDHVSSSSTDDDVKDEEQLIIKITQYIAFIGPCKAGKTSLINAIKGNKFNNEYTPSKLEEIPKQFMIKDESVEITCYLKDFSGKKEYFDSITLKLLNCNAIIMVIDLNEYDKTINEITEWCQYINENGNNFNRVLIVGNKYDLNKSNKNKLKNIGKQYYFETKYISCKSGKNIDKITKWLQHNAASFVSNPNDTKEFRIDTV